MPASPTRSLDPTQRLRVEQGDWQTPRTLADAVVGLLLRRGERFESVLEPTCGTGALLVAAERAFPHAELHGFDGCAEYVARAATALAGTGARLEVADFFATDWAAVLAALPEPLLLLGNPPWVTSATLGVLEGSNLPVKSNFKRERGLAALTGKSNFDISEWMLLRLLEAARGRRFTLAMLCKAAVARRLMERCAALAWPVEGATYAVDARSHFAASVAAVLLVLASRTEENQPDGPATPNAQDAAQSTLLPAQNSRWAVYPSLTASEPERYMGVSGGRAYSDLDAQAATAELEGPSELAWRSGVKHDLARVMELVASDAGFVNGLGERVELEPDYVYPLCKATELVRGAARERRFVVVTQRALGEDTRALAERAPLTWRYLERHAAAFAARKSRVYRGQPPFAMFGVGDYTFAEHKVAVSALHKQPCFRALAPREGRPVVLDDTSYFLPCASAEEAARLERALRSELARAFFAARMFRDAMRPVNKALLETLSLSALLARVS